MLFLQSNNVIDYFPPLSCRFSHDGQAFPSTNDERTVSFVVNDGIFNSTRVLACIRLIESNDLPALFTSLNDTVDSMVMYTEGQDDPLYLAPHLVIRGQRLKTVIIISLVSFFFLQ